jgi:hypothetical protein
VPDHGHATIDHLAIGHGGVTVIDTKRHGGEIRAQCVGGLFAPPREVLMIGGRDQTRLVNKLERQLEHVRSALAAPRPGAMSTSAARCLPEVDGLPLLWRLEVRGVLIDGRKGGRPAGVPGREPASGGRR